MNRTNWIRLATLIICLTAFHARGEDSSPIVSRIESASNRINTLGATLLPNMQRGLEEHPRGITNWPDQRGVQPESVTVRLEPYSATQPPSFEGGTASSTGQRSNPDATRSSPLPTERFLLPSNRWSLTDAARPAPPSTATTTLRQPAPVPQLPVTSTFGGPPTGIATQTDITRAAIPGLSTRYGPGGISFSRAAAERLVLNIQIEGVAYHDGHIILSGRQSAATRLDAALFLTSLRLACDAGDPFFSLDPVDGKAWSDQSEAAMRAVWERLKSRLNEKARYGQNLTVKTFDVRRDFAAVWADLAPRYPELQTKLVFQPAWLKQTRFGEILFKADVVLKELCVGVSVLQPGTPVRARQVPKYMSSAERGAAKGLLKNVSAREPDRWSGQRMWFDLVPDVQTSRERQSEDAQPQQKPPQSRAAIYGLLKARGFLDAHSASQVQSTALYEKDRVTDLAHVYPRMFVRRHDQATGKDLPGSSPDHDYVANDVNERMSSYADAYEELRDLTDVFRAYLAAIRAVGHDQRLCPTIKRMPLLPEEKLATPLPDVYPSALFVTVAQYVSTNGATRTVQLASQSSVSGGVAVRGRAFVRAATISKETSVIREVREELGSGVRAARWTGSSGRHYIALNVDPREPPPKVPITAGPARN